MDKEPAFSTHPPGEADASQTAAIQPPASAPGPESTPPSNAAPAAASSESVSPPATAPSPEQQELQAARLRVTELEARLNELVDGFARAKAEAENVRRRSEEELSKVRKFAVEAFAESLLPVKDSLEAAVAVHAGLAAAAPADSSVAQVLEGVHATLRQLSTALERNKVLEINPAMSTKFDPHQHQAISLIPSDQEPNTVVSVLQKGYVISERILRPALVTVSTPK